MEKGYTVITGATGGLGGAFTRLCFKENEPLVLLGRSEEKLAALKGELLAERSNAEVLTYAVDLTNAGSRDEFMQDFALKNGKIKRLINVAGVDTQKGFTLYTQEKIVFQTRVNFEAAVCLCKFALDHAAEGLEIINVSSISGSCPMPYFAIYSASKRALTDFSLALREEVKKDGVKVTAVTPGGIPTREDVKEQIKGQGLWGKLTAKSPETVARASLKGVKKNKAVVVPGFFNKAMTVFTKLLPRGIKLKFIAKRWSKISKDAF
ncbi:MAG: SDR family NAD(P)-dependent oxidoreductase [Clostridia bacterium]|nr:SDR family NAD(P)-dependent oxidoreductase [Clostridia bacterium]